MDPEFDDIYESIFNSEKPFTDPPGQLMIVIYSSISLLLVVMLILGAKIKMRLI